MSAPAPASSRNEAVIWVTAKMRRRRLLPAGDAHSAAGEPEASRRIRRGQAGNKRQENGGDQRQRDANPHQA